MNIEPRINNPKAVASAEIKAILARGWRPTIQFSSPPSSRDLLRTVNSLCTEYGDRLEVRFYGHYGTAFDTSVLDAIPDVQWLSVDCLDEIREPHRIAELPKLRKLCFGVYRFDDADFLQSLPLERLEWLTLSGTAKTGFDLGPLTRCAQLSELLLNEHTRNIEALADLPRLERLSLGSMPKKQGLRFLSGLHSLRSCTLILGGRPNIADFAHEGLEELSVLRVRGFEDLGSLGRFPSLRTLQIEDQLQLRALDLAGAPLESLIVMNCKNLERLHRLDDLTALREIRIGRTKLDLDELVGFGWPASMDIVALYSGSNRWNAAARAVLDQRGYREFTWSEGLRS